MIQATPTGTAEKQPRQRFRSACDSCRESKVKCSGGSVCLRCNKHDFTCRYSLASRAGKPKGSKNKATLKKLETFQEKSHQGRYYSDSVIPTLLGPSQTMNVSGSYWQASIPGSNMEHRQPQSTSTNLSPSNLEGAECSSSSHGSSLAMNLQIPDMETSAFSSNGNPTYYPSPISPGTQSHLPPLLVETLRTEPEAFAGLMTDHLSYLSESSPTQSARPFYSSSPTEEEKMISPFHQVFPEPPTPVDLLSSCDCLENQATSLNLLHSLGRKENVFSSGCGGPRFDTTIETVSKALASCQALLGCSICPKECSKLLVSILTLEGLFAVLGQVVVRELAQAQQDSPPAFSISPMDDGGRSIPSWCGPYHGSNLPRREEETSNSGMRRYLINRTLAQSGETLAALKTVVEHPSHNHYGLPLHSLSMDGNHRPWEVNPSLLPGCSYYYYFDHLSSPSPDHLIAPAMFSTSSYSLFANCASKPGNNLCDSDVTLLRQVISRCETALEGMQSLTTMTTTTTTSSYQYTEPLHAENLPSTLTSPCWIAELPPQQQIRTGNLDDSVRTV